MTYIALIQKYNRFLSDKARNEKTCHARVSQKCPNPMVIQKLLRKGFGQNGIQEIVNPITNDEVILVDCPNGCLPVLYRLVARTKNGFPIYKPVLAHVKIFIDHGNFMSMNRFWCMKRNLYWFPVPAIDMLEADVLDVGKRWCPFTNRLVEVQMPPKTYKREGQTVVVTNYNMWDHFVQRWKRGTQTSQPYEQFSGNQNGCHPDTALMKSRPAPIVSNGYGYYYPLLGIEMRQPLAGKLSEFNFQSEDGYLFNNVPLGYVPACYEQYQLNDSRYPIYKLVGTNPSLSQFEHGKVQMNRDVFDFNFRFESLHWCPVLEHLEEGKRWNFRSNSYVPVTMPQLGVETFIKLEPDFFSDDPFSFYELHRLKTKWDTKLEKWVSGSEDCEIELAVDPDEDDDLESDSDAYVCSDSSTGHRVNKHGFIVGFCNRRRPSNSFARSVASVMFQQQTSDNDEDD